MRPWLIAVSTFVGCASQPALSQVDGCPSCTVNVTLSRSQADCVTQRVDALLTRKLDPVFFDASSCSRPTVTMSVPMVKGPEPAPPQEATALWLQLTKRQLACLKLKLVQSLARSDQPIVLILDNASCPTSAP